METWALCFVLFPDDGWWCLISMVKAEMFGVGGSFMKLSRKPGERAI